MGGWTEWEGRRKGWKMGHKSSRGSNVVQARRPPWRRQQKGPTETTEVGQRKMEVPSLCPAGPTAKKSTKKWVMHAYTCPLRQLSSALGSWAREGARDWGPTTWVKSQLCHWPAVCPPQVRSLLRASLSAPWDAGDNRSLSTAVKFAGITYVKAHGRCSISIPSRSRSASPPGAGGIATHQPEVEEGRGRAVVPTPGRQKRLL